MLVKFQEPKYLQKGKRQFSPSIVPTETVELRLLKCCGQSYPEV